MNIETRIANFLTESATGKERKVWKVWIKNNYYNGKYADYGARPFVVAADSEEAAKKIVLDNADVVLAKLIATKNNGRSILPKSSALKITDKLIGRIELAKGYDGAADPKFNTSKGLNDPQEEGK